MPVPSKRPHDDETTRGCCANATDSTSDSDQSAAETRRGLLWIVALLGIIGNGWMILTPPGYGRFSIAVFLGTPTLVLCAGAYLLGRIGRRPLITFAAVRPQDRGRLLGFCLLANVAVSGLMLVYLFFL
jgi:hypothetical protein